MDLILLLLMIYIILFVIIGLGGCIIGLAIYMINPDAGYRWMQVIQKILNAMTFKW